MFYCFFNVLWPFDKIVDLLVLIYLLYEFNLSFCNSKLFDHVSNCTLSFWTLRRRLILRLPVSGLYGVLLLIFLVHLKFLIHVYTKTSQVFRPLSVLTFLWFKVSHFTRKVDSSLIFDKGNYSVDDSCSCPSFL